MSAILIAEPHPSLRELIATVAADLGHEAVEDGRRRPVDLLIVDPAHPISLELAQTLRGDLPDLPIICTSSTPPAGDALALGAVAYLEKPFSVAELESAIEAALATAGDRGSAQARDARSRREAAAD